MNHSTGNLRPSVAIVADSWDAYESIADACAAADFLAEWVRPPAMNPCIPDGQSLADAGIWDVRWGDEQEWGEIAEFVRHLSPAPVIAIQGFPRWQDAQRAARIGVAALLAKPFNIPDLWRALAGDDVVSARLALPADPAHPANHSTTVSPPDYNLQEGTVHRASLPNPSRKV